MQYQKHLQNLVGKKIKVVLSDGFIYSGWLISLDEKSLILDEVKLQSQLTIDLLRVSVIFELKEGVR